MPYYGRHSAPKRLVFFCPRLRDDNSGLSFIPFCHVLTLCKCTGLHDPRTVDTVLIHLYRAISCPPFRSPRTRRIWDKSVKPHDGSPSFTPISISDRLTSIYTGTVCHIIIR